VLRDVPVEIGRDEARDAAVRELSDPAYQAAEPTWLDRALQWVVRRLSDLFATLGSITPGGYVGLIVLVAVIIGLVVVVRLRVGKFARHGRGDAMVFAGGPRSADEHRRAAEEAAARGDLAEAVRERFRAIVRGLEERGILDERSGRTVDEAATEAGRRLPQSADDLRAAARLFDDVWYGGRPATAADYQRLTEVDNQVRGQRPAMAGAGS
jgi:uncharacterized protein DUF4129